MIRLAATRSGWWWAAGLAISVVIAPELSAQVQLTAEDYARAERLLSRNVNKLALKLTVQPHWIDGGDRFWYRNQTRDGKEFILVDPVRRARGPLFDHSRLAGALSVAADTAYVAANLPFESVEVGEGGNAVTFDIGTKRWTCRLAPYACSSADEEDRVASHELASPDGRWAAYTHEHNLYVRSLSGTDTVQLTTDGIEHYDYASRPEDRTSAVTERRLGIRRPPSLAWSPDSKRLVTHRLDQRNVEQLHLVQAAPLQGYRPVSYSYRYALAGDSVLPLAKLAVFDVTTKTRVDVDAEPMISVYVPAVDSRYVWWSEDEQRVYFIDRTRGDKAVQLRVADASTGQTRTIIEESGPTNVELHPLIGARPNVRVLGDGAEVIWFSERDGWGHLYLHDGQTGELVGQITKGSWLVRNVVHVDEGKRQLYFTAGGQDPERNPYYRHLYRINLDGSGLTLLSTENADHAITASPSGEYFVDTYSQINVAPKTVLRDADGRILQPLEDADIELLMVGGHRWERFTVKAADGVTDLYGALYFPSNFDSTKSYPIIDFIYPGPQINRVPASFTPPPPLTELGFIGFMVDGRGTPFRSKAFHNFSYGNLESAGGLDDHVQALRQLAAERPYLDLERVGITGHSGGGFASAHAMLAYPDFYKVAVSSAGNHDQRAYISFWGEHYHGLVEGDNYVQQSNATHAANLKGKLLLAWGELDDNVHPANTIQLIDALMKANKDFDMLMLPNENHGFGGTNGSYFRRKQWDYFVRHLLGAEPPKGYQMSAPGM